MNTTISRSLMGAVAWAALSLAQPLLSANSTLPAEPSATVSDQLPSGDFAGSYVAQALAHNPQIKAAELRYQAARQSVDSAGALPNPRIQIAHFVESIQTRTGPQRQSLQLQQPLPAFGRRGAQRDVAAAGAQALWHAQARQQLALAEKVAEKAIEVGFLDKAIQANEENLELLRQWQAVVEDKVKAGGSLNDLIQVQVEVQSYEDRSAKLGTDRAVALAELQSLTGKTHVPAARPVEWQAPPPLQASAEQWLNAIPTRSPQLAMLRSLESSQAARERLARSTSRPEFSLGLNYTRTGDALNSATPDSGKDPWAIVVGFSLPIWEKANTALTRQATLQQEAIGAEIDALTLELEAQGQAWVARLEDAQKRTQRYAESLLPLARQGREIAESSYRSGQSSLLELIESDRRLLNLETQYWRSAADTWLARWKLATLSGGLWLE